MTTSLQEMMRSSLRASLALLFLSGPAWAEGAVTLKIGYAPGGGYDAVGRLVADHLGGFLPGRPDIVVENVDGAGSLKLAKLMAGSEAADGSVIALVNSSVTIATVTRPELADFDARSFNWIGSMNDTPSLCVVPNASPVRSVEELLAADLIAGSTGKTSATYVMAALLRNALGGRFKLVTGFKGGAEVNLAMERGEIGLRCGYSLTSFQALGTGLLRPVGQWTMNVPETTRDLPSFLDLIEDAADRKAAELVIGNLAFDNPLLLPPGTPQATVDAYRAGFDAMVADPAFQADAAGRNIELSPKPGEKVAEIIDSLVSVDKSVIARAAELAQ
ncbi:tripartite-type tricarboxylate transporter receptor subunit TctC [Hoeflea marina]|uniref:Tripartite-type tricarboxylate transporter receptor subunit TctC n=1 Tax=Hoeflea marina TaxID=274592 RepID=A0A317PQN9_9HYPH|nr:tripartite tricarboxylate transporter substrate-binding protein [Hoeflea marina]PWW03499.1 tripartite-type tricarboxylate transporter receptor subunit TctC [Hoeflea marina]